MRSCTPSPPTRPPTSPPTQGCYAAFRRQLNATHAVSCVPGSQAVTEKAALVGSLAAAYGPAAWGVVPRSFRLPTQYGEMAAHLKRVGGWAAGWLDGWLDGIAAARPDKLGDGGLAGGERQNDLLAPAPCFERSLGRAHSNQVPSPPPAPVPRYLLQEHAAGRSSLWVLKEDVHRGKGVAVVTPPQLLSRALEGANRQGWLGGGWDWRGLLGGGSWDGWQRMLRLRAARQGWRGVLAHLWGTWNGAMNRLWRSMRSAASWRAWRGAASSTRHVLAQQFLGDQYLVDGRPFYIR